MKKKSRFTKWGYEPVVLNTKAREVFDSAFLRLRKQYALINKSVEEAEIRVAYDEYGDIHYELSFVVDEKRNEIICTSVYEFESKIFDFVVGFE